MSIWVSHPGPDLIAEDYDGPGPIVIGVAGTSLNDDKPIRLSMHRCNPDTHQYWPDEEGRVVEMTAAEARELAARLIATVAQWG